MLDEHVTLETEAMIRAIDPLGQARFQLQGTRWTSTRTHPSIPQGEPFFLTYSFVLDGTSIPASFWDTDQNAQSSTLFATMDAQFDGGMDGFRAKVREAFDQWEATGNFRYVEVPDDGAAFTVANGGAVPSATAIGRGDIRIAMRLIDDAGVDLDDDGTTDRNVLAYNRYPGNGGDMVLDAGNMSTFTNAANDFRRLKNVLLHEHGHGLGLRHVMPQTFPKLMEPALNTNFDGPQEDEIRAIAAMYGDPAESNNSLNAATPIGSIAEGQPSVLAPNYEMALERNASDDWYKFNATGGSQLTITLDPVGTTYQHGAQPLDPNADPVLTTINAAAARDLQVILYNQSGVLLVLSDDTGAGQSETLTIDALPATGTYYLRVNSTDGNMTPQRYQLALARQSEPEINVVAQVIPPVDVLSGDTFDFGDTTVNTDRHFFFTIENEGSGTLALTNNPHVAIFGADAGDFNVNLQPNSAAIEAGAPVSFNIGFRPSAGGPREATVLISNDDADESAYVFTVIGNGLSSSSGPSGSAEIKVFQVTPAFLFGKVEVEEGGFSDFPEVGVNDDLVVYYFIENHGDGDLVLSDDVQLVSPISGFSIFSQHNGLPIPAGNPEGFADNFRVQFAPQDTNTQTMRVFIYSNAGNTIGPFDFTLRGAGIEQIEDCNSNGVDDVDELADNDCNDNGIPDECDSDSDGDGVPDDCDLCDGEDDLRDTDADGTTDCLDECPTDASKVEPGDCGCNNEESADCGIEVCADGDDDFDGVCNSEDVCPGQDDLLDLDGGGTPDCIDGEDDNEDENDDEDEDNEDEDEDDDENDNGRDGFCGAGSTMPMMAAMLMMCGTGIGRRVRRTSRRNR